MSALSTAAGIVLDTDIDIDVDVDVDADNKLNCKSLSHISHLTSLSCLVNVSRCGNNFPACADRVAWDPPWC